MDNQNEFIAASTVPDSAEVGELLPEDYDYMRDNDYEFESEQYEAELEYERKRIASEKVAAARKALRTSLFPLVSLQTILNIPHSDTKPILDKLIYPGAVTLLAGDSKVGKSTFLFHALLAIANGKEHIGLSTRPAKIMYISEQPYQSLRKQLIEVPEMLKYAGENLKFIPFDNNVVKKTRSERNEATNTLETKEVEAFPGSWEEQVTVWQEAVSKWSPQIVVLDTYTSFAQLKSGELFDSGPVIAKIQQLKALIIDEPELAIVILHHCRKENNQSQGMKSFHDMAGSYGFRAATDINVLLTKPHPESHPTLRKVQIEGRYVDNPDGEETLWYGRQNGKLTATDDPSKNVLQEISAKVKANPEWNELSIRELAKKVGYSKTTVERFRKDYPVSPRQ